MNDGVAKRVEFMGVSFGEEALLCRGHVVHPAEVIGKDGEWLYQFWSLGGMLTVLTVLFIIIITIMVVIAYDDDIINAAFKTHIYKKQRRRSVITHTHTHTHRERERERERERD